jgi:hypothetical protein
MGDDLESGVLGELKGLAGRLDGVSTVRISGDVLVDRLNADLLVVA